MKKIVHLLLAFFMVLVAVSPVMAKDDKHVFDFANLLSAEEIKELENMFDQIEKEFSMDIVVYVENNAKLQSEKQAQNYANELYDTLDRGVGSEKDGMLFYVTLVDSGGFYAFSTRGKGIRVFDDARLEDMDNNVFNYLVEASKTGSMYKAFVSIAADSDYYLRHGIDPNGHSTVVEHKEPRGLFYPPYIMGACGVGLLLSWIIMQAQKSQLKSVYRHRNASDYISKALRLYDTRDMFLYRSESRVRIQQQTSSHSSGGGGSHYHGGRSGRF